jgi:cell division transport system permease protein
VIDVRSARRLAVSLRSGLRGARERPLVFGLSVATMAAGLLVLGTYLLIAANLRGVLERVGADLKLVAFTSVGAAADPGGIEALGTRLRALPGVAELHYVAPDEALNRLRGDLGEDAGVLDGMAKNPLPGSFEIVVAAERREPAELRALAAVVGGVPGVAEVRFGEAWVEGYARVVRMVEWLGAGLGAFLVLVLGAIVAATVRLSLHARADEIQIQRLVGAGGLFSGCRSIWKARCRADSRRSPHCCSCARSTRSACPCSVTRSAGWSESRRWSSSEPQRPWAWWRSVCCSVWAAR